MNGLIGHIRHTYSLLAALALTLTLPALARAEGEFELPPLGVDIAGAVTAAGLALGAIVVVCVGTYVGFLLVRKGIQWLRVALR